jgi:hypothetical protein
MMQQGLESLLITKTVKDLSGFNKIEQSHEEPNMKAMKALHNGRRGHVPLKMELQTFKTVSWGNIGTCFISLFTQFWK